MSEKKSLDDLFQDLKPLWKLYKRRFIVHKKTNTRYFITDIFYKEEDMSIWFSYEPMEIPVPFSRPISELTDGRFEL